MDTTEEFVDFFSSDLMDLIDASNIHDTAREELKDAILVILTDGLLPAHEQLQKIRASIAEPLTHKQLYEDFTRLLWHAYKDLMPAATLLLGFDLAFLFQKESSFKKGVLEFRMDHPTLIAPNLGEFFRRQRDAWQSNLARFRAHFIEPTPADRTKFAAFYQPQNAEMLFAVVWGVMANIFPVFVESNFPPDLTIEVIPEGKRASSKGKRFHMLPCNPIKR
jgi:hypothetical protein